MLAHAVARPVLERLAARPGRATALGAGRTAAYLDLDGWVLAVTARGVPLMPNGVALASVAPGGLPAGTAVEAGPSGLWGPGGWSATWDALGPPAWDPSVPRLARTDPGALRARGASILAARGLGAPPGPRRVGLDPGAGLPITRAPAGRRREGLVAGQAPAAAVLSAGGLEPRRAPALRALDAPPLPDLDPWVASLPAAGVILGREAREAVRDLLASLTDGDPVAGARAAEDIIGRGPGLTPEGDDLLAGVASVLAATGGVDVDAAWRTALSPPDLRERTTPLSATLLELAVNGQVVEPVRALLDLSPAGEAAWPAALRRLERIGHSTGPAYAAGVGAALVLARPSETDVVPP